MPDRRPRGYQPRWRPRPATLELLAAVEVILLRYREQLPISIRQIFYAAVTDGVLAKTEAAYKRLVEVLGMARRSGRLPWEVIRDDSAHHAEPPPAHTGPDAFWDGVHQAAASYRRDRQEGQPVRIEVWAEAAGTVPQLARLAHPYGIPVHSGGGFDSLPGKRDAALRAAADPRGLVVLHCGDLDPSGVHLPRALAEDLAAFAGAHGGHAELVRVAVTEDQVERYRLPTAPAKPTDRRSFAPAATTQAEALPPDVLADLVRQAIEERRDAEVFRAVLEQEEAERQRLLAALD